MTLRRWIIRLIVVGLLGIGATLLDGEARTPNIDIALSDWFFRLESFLISAFVIGVIYLLWAGVRSKLESVRISAYTLLFLVGVRLYFFDSSPNHVTWFTGIFFLALFGSYYLLDQYIRNRRTGKKTLHLEIKNKSAAQPLFESLANPCWYLLALIGGEPDNWQLGSLELWPFDVVIKQKQRPPFRSQIFIFNLENIRWISSIQTFSEAESEIWFDLEIDGLWYTLRLRLENSLVEHFVEQIGPGLPVSLWTSEHLRYTNVRFGSVTAHPATVATYGEWLLAELLQLYLTPLYLVLLHETFVQQAIPLNEIERLEILAAANLPDQQIVRFGHGDKTLAFAVQDQDFVQVMKERLS